MLKAQAARPDRQPQGTLSKSRAAMSWYRPPVLSNHSSLILILYSASGQRIHGKKQKAKRTTKILASHAFSSLGPKFTSDGVVAGANHKSETKLMCAICNVVQLGIDD